MRAVILGDVHLSDVPPSVRTPAYAEQILAKLSFARETAVAVGASVIVQAGDMFHIKTPTRTSHRLVQAVHEVLTDAGSSGIPVRVVPGNHDLRHDRLDTLSSQPLGSLCRMKGFDFVLGESWEFPVFGVPFLADWKELPVWADQFRSRCLRSDELLIVSHAPLVPDSESVPYEVLQPKDWAGLFGPGQTYYGHIHNPHGVYEVDGHVFCNNGALSRGSLHQESLTRQPAITVYDGETRLFEKVPVPVLPAEEVFVLESVERVEAKRQDFSEFLTGLGSQTVAVDSVEEVVARVDMLEVSDEVRARARELVAWAQEAT